MADLFYILGVIFFFHELGILYDPSRHLDRIRLAERINKSKNEDGTKREALDGLNGEEKKSFMKTTFFHLSYLIWSILGILFAGQWIVFAGLLTFGMTSSFFRRRFYKDNTRKSKLFFKFDSFVSLVILAYLVVNHFHQIF